MDASSMIWAVIAAMGIPSAVTAFCFWMIERKIQKKEEAEKAEREKREKEQDRKDAARQQNEVIMVRSIGAAMALAEATAKAVQRIPDAHCNGDMHAAIEYAAQVKHEQKDFLTKYGIEAIYE